LAVDHPAGVMIVRSPPSGTAITAISTSAVADTSSAETVVRVGASFGQYSRHTSVIAAASVGFLR
jgi:hypothetical protein